MSGRQRNREMDSTMARSESSEHLGATGWSLGALGGQI